MVLVNPTNPDLSYYYKGQPLGLAYLAAVIEKQGYPVDIVDANLYDLNTDNTVTKILELIDADEGIVGFTTYLYGFDWVARTAGAVKEARPDLRTLIGGHHATAMPREILSECPQFDFLIRGEGEFPMIELLDAVSHDLDFDQILGLGYKTTDGYEVNSMRDLIDDLDSLPFPARHKLPPVTEYAERAGIRTVLGQMITSRGCPFQCTFCDIQTFYKLSKGKLWRTRSPRLVVDEVEQLIRLGAERIVFNDDTFTINREHPQGIAEELIRRSIGIPWECETRAELIIRFKDLLPLFKKSGCRAILIGAESGSEEQLRRYQKGTTVEQNSLAIRLIREAGIDVVCGFILFDPFVSLGELEENSRFLIENDMWYAEVFNHLVPLPNTPVYYQLLEKGIITPDVYGKDLVNINPQKYFQNDQLKTFYTRIQDWRAEVWPLAGLTNRLAALISRVTAYNKTHDTLQKSMMERIARIRSEHWSARELGRNVLSMFNDIVSKSLADFNADLQPIIGQYTLSLRDRRVNLHHAYEELKSICQANRVPIFDTRQTSSNALRDLAIAE